MSFFCLICSLSALSPGCYCWCPTNSAPAHSSEGRQCRGCPFISILISSVGVAPAERLWSRPLLLYHYTQQHHLGGEWAHALVLQDSCSTLYLCRVTFSPTQTKPSNTGLNQTWISCIIIKSCCISLNEDVLLWIKTKTVWKFNITLIRSCTFGLAPLCHLPIKCEVTGTDIKHAWLQTEYANVSTFFLMF